MIEYNGIELNEKLIPIVDSKMSSLKENWYSEPQKQISLENFVNQADEWFKSTRLNVINGWDRFPYADAIMGCTHYIESFIIKHGWDGFQILPREYGYYGMMGKWGTEPGNLKPNVPLILSLPNWNDADIRPEWPDILKECEEKNIDIHIDFAWITVAKNISIDVSHPNIKSFAMSLSKYNMQWNRVGLRWTRQRTMDSITMFNHYYGDVNSGIMSCGSYIMNNLPRDYLWDTHGDNYKKICNFHGLIETNFPYVVKIPNDSRPKGIAHLLLKKDHVFN